MQMARLNDTENETAAFNMGQTIGQTIGQSEHNTDYAEQANYMSHTVRDMEMNQTKISMKVGVASVDGSLSGEETDELQRF